jgi:magnesium-transporting ATPase (P-type)
VAGGFIEPAATASPDFALVHRRFLRCACCCHDLKLTGEGARSRWIGDPMELALVRMAGPSCPAAAVFERVYEFMPHAKRTGQAKAP